MTKTARMIVVSIALCLGATGCTRHLTDDRIAGDYSVSGEWGRSTLTLKPNGTFSQNLFLEGKSVKGIEGKWRMLDSNVHGYTRTIEFEPFINMWAKQRGAPTPNASYTVESIGFRGVWIDVDSDAGTTYKKQ
jgi:hypothetical protein